MFKKKATKDNWFNRCYKLYKKNKLPSPYYNLFYYYINTSYTTKKKGFNRDHYELLHWAEDNNFLNNLTNDLRSVLPQDLFDNFSAALEKYKLLNEDMIDDPEFNIIEYFEEYDDYAFEHSEKIEEILCNYILRTVE